ncbi:MAG: 30S ribosomal protein S16 [Candidatus Gracilibacteria bacterium]|jgi:small subunit ribosomal protein S16
MLMIRFSRAGRKRAPHYRIVVTEHTKPAKCGEIEVIGWYDPRSKKYELDMESVRKRVSLGAQMSESFARLLKKNSLSV